MRCGSRDLVKHGKNKICVALEIEVFHGVPFQHRSVTLPDVTRDLDDFQITRLFFNRGDLEEAGIEKNLLDFSNCRVEYMFVRFIYIYTWFILSS